MAKTLGANGGEGTVMADLKRARTAPTGPSPFRVAAAPLVPTKFMDSRFTAQGEPRASVAPVRLKTLWFNTGTLCNLHCATCYIESSPSNDALVYPHCGRGARSYPGRDR